MFRVRPLNENKNKQTYIIAEIIAIQFYRYDSTVAFNHDSRPSAAVPMFRIQFEFELFIVAILNNKIRVGLEKPWEKTVLFLF